MWRLSTGAPIKSIVFDDSVPKEGFLPYLFGNTLLSIGKHKNLRYIQEYSFIRIL